MLRRALPVALPFVLIASLTACGGGDKVEPPARPALVVQPIPAGDAVDTYPGEVRARLEPELAFRIAGKISKRLVEVGERVKKDQPLAELDPEDVRLQLEAIRAQVAAAEANLADGSQSIVFLPSGGSTGGSITVLRQTQPPTGLRLRVDWLSGLVSREQP